MAAYFVALAKVTDETEGLAEYVRLSAELGAKLGAEYVVRGPAETVYEGDYLQDRAVIVYKWPSMQVAKDYYESEEYQKRVKPLRDNTGIYDIGVFEEVE